MKICPVCGDATFDDQPVCYGCLHRFDEGEDAPRKAAPQRLDHAKPAKPATVLEFGQAAGFDEPEPGDEPKLAMRAASFLVSFAPSHGKDGAMQLTCTVRPIDPKAAG